MKFLVYLLLIVPSIVIAESTRTFYCPLETWSPTKLKEFKDQEFVLQNSTPDKLAIDTLDCLAHSNPKIRDDIAYTAFSTWLRKDMLSNTAKQTLYVQLSTDIKSQMNDEQGVYLPFAALVFSEVVRADRITAYLSKQELDNAVSITAKLLAEVKDYRGFENTIGWRHLVAHSADIALQLVLNKRLTPKQHVLLTDKLFDQASPSNHSYVFGESKRLTMPILYSWLSESYDIDVWQRNLDKLMNPTPFSSWQDMYRTEQGLHKLHNTRAFLLELYRLTSSNNIDRLKLLQPSIESALRQLG